MIWHLHAVSHKMLISFWYSDTTLFVVLLQRPLFLWVKLSNENSVNTVEYDTGNYRGLKS